MMVVIFSFINIFKDLPAFLVAVIAGFFVLAMFIQYTLVTFLRKDLDTLIDFLELSEKEKKENRFLNIFGFSHFLHNQFSLRYRNSLPYLVNGVDVCGKRINAVAHKDFSHFRIAAFLAADA